MWIMGFLQLISTQVWISLPLGFLVLGFLGGVTFAEAWQVIRRFPLLWVSFLFWPFATVISIIVMRGATNLEGFQKYTWVLIAASLTLVSMPIICLGVIQVPLGLWLLRLLLRPDVRARFEAVARGDKIDQSRARSAAE